MIPYPLTQGKHVEHAQGVAFHDPEEVWFWFMRAQQARIDGARFIRGEALYPRPCEPLDILKILERLYRNRILHWDHVRVLHHYGKRFLPPDPRRIREARAAFLWEEAMKNLAPVFIRKGIMSPPSFS